MFRGLCLFLRIIIYSFRISYFMRQLILALALCVAFAFEASAQLYTQIPVPEAVQQKDCDMVTDPTSACNTGGEAFSDFLTRFRTDNDFCASRFYIPESEDDDDMSALAFFKETYLEYREQGTQDFTPSYSNDGCTESLATWYGVTADHALFVESRVYNCESDDPDVDNDMDDGIVIWTFERKDGKWFVTEVMVAG